MWLEKWLHVCFRRGCVARFIMLVGFRGYADMLFTKLFQVEKSWEHGGMTVNIHKTKHLVVVRDAIDGDKAPFLVSKIVGVDEFSILGEFSIVR